MYLACEYMVIGDTLQRKKWARQSMNELCTRARRPKNERCITFRQPMDKLCSHMS